MATLRCKTSYHVPRDIEFCYYPCRCHRRIVLESWEQEGPPTKISTDEPNQRSFARFHHANDWEHVERGCASDYCRGKGISTWLWWVSALRVCLFHVLSIATHWRQSRVSLCLTTPIWHETFLPSCILLLLKVMLSRARKDIFCTTDYHISRRAHPSWQDVPSNIGPYLFFVDNGIGLQQCWR